MELKWNKFVQEDKNSYPKNDGNYMVFGIQSCRNGNWMTNKIYCHLTKGRIALMVKLLLGILILTVTLLLFFIGQMFQTRKNLRKIFHFNEVIN